MLDEEKYPRCARCMHRMKHDVLPDICVWVCEYCKDVNAGRCWYDGGAPVHDWQADSLKHES